MLLCRAGEEREFHVVGGVWPPPVTMQINALELFTVLKVIQHFAPMLTNQHVMICTDNKATAAYINRQGGVRSAQLLSIARQLLCWAHTHLRSIRAVYIPGVLYRGADILSRRGPQPGDWTLHHNLINQIWSE